MLRHILTQLTLLACSLAISPAMAKNNSAGKASMVFVGDIMVAHDEETGKLIESKLGYYIRPGKHSMTSGDWNVFLDFADKQWK